MQRIINNYNKKNKKKKLVYKNRIKSNYAKKENCLTNNTVYTYR